MTLIACPECQRQISSSATSCPHCGYPLVEPWTRKLETAWEQGFRRAWITTVGFPLIWLVAVLTTGDLLRTPDMLVTILPWFFIVGLWGLFGGLAVIALAAFVRTRWLSGGGDMDPWRWTVHVQIILIALFGAFVSMVA